MTARIAALAAILTLAVAPPAAPMSGSSPSVVIRTDHGDITVALNLDAAPRTVCNFLRYVEAGAYAGGSFFRTVVAETNDNPHPIDVIQAATPTGSDDSGFGPILLERTRDSGLRHTAGVVSMARSGPDTATSSFFIVVRDAPALDFGGGRNPDGQGFAAFGEVVSGMAVVRAINALPAKDEQITPPVKITAIEASTPAPDQCRR